MSLPKKRNSYSSLFLLFVFLSLFFTQQLSAQQQADPLNIINVGTGSSPAGIGIDPTTRMLFVADWTNSRVLRYPSIDTLTSASIPNGVFGQPDFISTGANQGFTLPTAATLNWPRGLCVNKNGILFVADANNNRILFWKNAATRANGDSADGVIGQFNFSTNSASLGPSGISAPNGITCNDTTLWVADQANNRILRFDNAGLAGFPTTGAQANAVIGQSTFSSNIVGNDATGLSDPGHVLATPNQGLYIGDVGNNRILYFPPSEAAKSTGATATQVYAKNNLTDTSSYATSARTTNSPGGLCLGSDGKLIHVAYSENRVLLFPPVPPNVDNLAAVGVLGQPDFISSTAGSAANQFSNPWMIQCDWSTETIWVTDSGNARIAQYRVGVPVTPVTTLNVDVSFQGTTPNVVMTPKDSTGNTQAGQKFILQPYQIDEVDSNGTVVSAIPLPLSGYTITYDIDADNNQFFTFNTTNPSPLIIKYSLFAVDQTLNSAGVTFGTAANALKFQVTLSNWVFAQATNSLRLHLFISVSPKVTGIRKSGSAGLTRFSLDSSGVMTTTINLLEFAEVDTNSNTPIDFSLNSVNDSTDSSQLDLVLNLPHFVSTLNYDPDFSVTLETGGDSSGDPDLLPLLALLALLIVPAIFILVAIGVGVFLYMRKYRRHRQVRVAVQAENY